MAWIGLARMDLGSVFVPMGNTPGLTLVGLLKGVVWAHARFKAWPDQQTMQGMDKLSPGP